MKRDPANELNAKQAIIATLWAIMLFIGAINLEGRINRWLGYSLVPIWAFILLYLMKRFRSKPQVKQ